MNLAIAIGAKVDLAQPVRTSFVIGVRFANVFI